MKRILFLLAGACVLFLPLQAFAQAAKIVDLGWQVNVKKDAASAWEKAKINMLLEKGAEIETKHGSYCTLAFDEERKNIVTIKQDSLIKIESIKPGNIFLPKGRVFSIITNLSKAEKFQIRTPTAIAGARGTGWATGYGGANTSAKCFKDTAYVQGLDEAGNLAGEQDLPSGMGLDIGGGGRFGELYQLGDQDYTEWGDFSGYTGDLTTEGSSGDTGGEEGGTNNPSIGDLREEQRGDYREDSLETIRGQESTPSQDSGQEEAGEPAPERPPITKD